MNTLGAWDYGILAGVLSGLGIGLFFIVRWIGKHVVKPVVDRHCKLVETCIKGQRHMARSLRKIADRGKDVLPLLLVFVFATNVFAQQWQPVQPDCPPGKG
jgi:hypothetical protein